MSEPHQIAAIAVVLLVVIVAVWGPPLARIGGAFLILATIPYIAYHFHRISPFGVVANLIAMPVVSAWVMPWGILGLLAMPLGLDHTCWWIMGLGIDPADQREALAGHRREATNGFVCVHRLEVS